MDKKLLEQLVSISYDNHGILQEKTVLEIANRLDRKALKQYIKALKKRESETTIHITLPHQPSQQIEKTVTPLFRGKKIEYEYDPSLLLGIKIKKNDIIYESNLRNTLTKLISHTVKRYDR